MSAARQLIKKLQDAGLQKRILPPNDKSSHGHNGAGGVFVPQINKLTVHYCHPRVGAGGNSAGMVDFIKNRIVHIAKARPYVEICVRPDLYRKPALVAQYASGKKVVVDCSHDTPREIEQKLGFLCDSRDGQEKKLTSGQPVIPAGRTGGEGVEPVWDPFTAKKTFKP
ncbi:uncharacterized protein EV422DRAFT_530146 [Fimicolochytrium jonesii]|uniref:uncharacterized protein n=1 Tax=Fimicolochytrium jonesii TaxID=1396493 RepID=UPI0022FE3DDD|nr:uncharacterized protein EV422DRAFT_530146 [Fimicolochytrium jonesii]KAI8820783.1 hypothetical protein EV422DRAFT_530146 [Fimicolochytrium jonesii]